MRERFSLTKAQWATICLSVSSAAALISVVTATFFQQEQIRATAPALRLITSPEAVRQAGAEAVSKAGEEAQEALVQVTMSLTMGAVMAVGITVGAIALTVSMVVAERSQQKEVARASSIILGLAALALPTIAWLVAANGIHELQQKVPGVTDPSLDLPTVLAILLLLFAVALHVRDAWTRSPR